MRLRHNHQISHGVGGCHVIAEPQHVVVRTSVPIPSLLGRNRASLRCGLLHPDLQQWAGLGGEEVQAARALAATGHQQDRALRVEPEFGGGGLARGQRADFGADRCAGLGDGSFWKIMGGCLHAHKDPCAKPACQQIGAPGNCIRFMVRRWSNRACIRQ